MYYYLIYAIAASVLAICSYGFRDLNLILSTVPAVNDVLNTMRDFTLLHRQTITVVWGVSLCAMTLSYGMILRGIEQMERSSLKYVIAFIVGIACIFVISYPANSYDIFNYITTAKITYVYGENPYLVMPTEIPGEPYLAFTRAANRTALYGPLWILISAIPHYGGLGQIWLTIVMFKLLNAAIYILFAWFIYKATKSVKNVLFFACNPLIVLEVLLSGHNDIYMMLPALFGLWYMRTHSITAKLAGVGAFVSSWFVKGATLVLLPVLFLRKISWENTLIVSYWLLMGVFVLVAPMREELYPWYAVWVISVAALLPSGKNSCIYWLTIVLSFSLELRHLPYMWMGYYEGPGPMLRLSVTVLPILVYLSVYLYSTYRKNSLQSS